MKTSPSLAAKTWTRLARHGRRWLLLAALFAVPTVALTYPSAAQAQDKAVSQKERREAKRLFNQAHLAYRRGDYEEAILKWEQSYELSEEPLIFLSIANAYERLGDTKLTLEYLTRWRKKAPRREHKELDSRIESLETRVKEIEAAEEQRRQEEARHQAEQEARLRAELEAKQRAERDEATDNEGAVWQIVGWSMIGAGGAAIVTGLIVDAVAAAGRPAEEEACTDSDGQLLCRDAQRDEIESSNTLAIAGDITWIAGSAIAAGGVVVLVVLGYADYGDEGQASIVPLVGPDGGGLMLTTTF